MASRSYCAAVAAPSYGRGYPRTVRRPRSGSTVLLVFSILMVIAVSGALLAFVMLYEGEEYAEVVRIGNEISSIANDVPSAPVQLTHPSDEVDDAPEEPGMSVERLYSHDPIDRELNWEGILAINSSVACWLYIPDMPIDYAVLEEPYSMDGSEYFYLRHDIYGTKSSSGWIFSVSPPGGATDMHQLIFGHNMGSGKEIMFGTLQKYKDKDFCKEHPYIYLYYPDRTERWAVWSVCNVSGDDNVYSMPYSSGGADYARLLLSLSDKAEYDTGITPPYSTERCLTLSTCDRGYGGNTGRFIVNGALDSVKYLDTGETVSAQDWYARQ